MVVNIVVALIALYLIICPTVVGILFQFRTQESAYISRRKYNIYATILLLGITIQFLRCIPVIVFNYRVLESPDWVYWGLNTFSLTAIGLGVGMILYVRDPWVFYTTSARFKFYALGVVPTFLSIVYALLLIGIMRS